MQAGAGARPDVPFFLVLLTDGKSQDDAVSAASRLKSIGVEIIAVGENEEENVNDSSDLMFRKADNSRKSLMCGEGVKNADEAELRQMASEPVDLNVYNVNDFPLLSKLVARLVHILCGRIEERGITKRNSSIRWTAPLHHTAIVPTYHTRNAVMLFSLQEWTRVPR